MIVAEKPKPVNDLVPPDFMDKETLFTAINAARPSPRLFWRLARAAGAAADPWAAVVSAARSARSPETAERLAALDPEAEARRQRVRARETGARILVHGRPGYPAALLEIPEPPPVLYVRGDLEDRDRIAVAVVGSRRASSRGRLAAEEMARDLAARGVTVVSGLAMGVDAWAHKGALAGGGRTVAVLGCGLDVPYPRYHAELRERIAGRGALVSEFPMGAPPLPMNFPRRNRIISGLCLGTLVIEAAARSGSLITARHALEQGRDVYAVPGGIDSDLSRGTNALIQQGAKLVQCVEDVIEEFPYEVRRYLAVRRGRAAAPAADRVEGRILGLVGSRPVHIDELTRQARLPAATVSSVLFRLELKGALRQLPGKRFLRA